MQVYMYTLLIEPVWNRNLEQLACFYPHSPPLLIEPVWNRNLPSTINQQPSTTFNRTSMELKRVVLSNRTDTIRVCKYFVV